MISQKLIGRFYSKIIVDDISDHLPNALILEGIAQPCKGKRLITSRDTRPNNLANLEASLAELKYDDSIKKNVNMYFDKFHRDLCENIAMHCPMKTQYVTQKQFRKEPWMTPGLLRCCAKSKRLYQTSILKDASHLEVNKYKTYRNVFNAVKCKCKQNYYREKCLEYRNNSKKLWQMINTCIGKTNDKTTIIDYIRIDNVEYYDNKTIADQFGSYFLKIGKQYANKIETPRYNIDAYLRVITRNPKSIFWEPTTKEEIIRIISDLPNKLSSGFDNIENVILKKIKTSLSPLLSDIFNQSMLQGTFPESMKLAEVVPLYKSKEKYLTTNYRPISLLITISKILEKLIHKCTYSFLQNTNQFYHSQYGF